jgi:predicted nucleotidyltransferase
MDGKFGLTDEEIKQIIAVLKSTPEVECGIIYGSRALGTYKRGSDIDLALKGKINLDVVAKVKWILEEETMLPYFFDITDYASITNQKLKQQIDVYGVAFYSKSDG